MANAVINGTGVKSKTPSMMHCESSFFTCHEYPCDLTFCPAKVCMDDSTIKSAHTTPGDRR